MLWIVAARRAGGELGRNVLGGRASAASQRESGGRLRIVSAESPARAGLSGFSSRCSGTYVASSGGGAFGQTREALRSSPAGARSAGAKLRRPPPRTFWTNAPPPRVTRRAPSLAAAAQFPGPAAAEEAARSAEERRLGHDGRALVERTRTATRAFAVAVPAPVHLGGGETERAPTARAGTRRGDPIEMIDGIGVTLCIAIEVLTHRAAAWRSAPDAARLARCAETLSPWSSCRWLRSRPRRGARADDASWLRVDAPAALESTAQLPLVEVRGHAAARGARVHEFVIVIDVSASAALPSGWDVDGDGASGRTDPALLARLLAKPDLPAGLGERLRDADFDDSVLGAELAATRALLARLETGARYRVGLVAFSDRARLLAPVGSSAHGARRRVRRAARGLPPRPRRHELRRRHRGGAARAAARVGRRSVRAAGRHRPVDPVPLRRGTDAAAARRPRAPARALRGVAPPERPASASSPSTCAREQKAGAVVLAEMAARSDGRFEVLDRPGDAIARLRRTDLAGLAELRIVNETTGAAARALRTFPDGSFDAFVELAPGRNHIVLRAHDDDGRTRGRRTLDRARTPERPPRPPRPQRCSASCASERARRSYGPQMERERRTPAPRPRSAYRGRADGRRRPGARRRPSGLAEVVGPHLVVDRAGLHERVHHRRRDHRLAPAAPRRRAAATRCARRSRASRRRPRPFCNSVCRCPVEFSSRRSDSFRSYQTWRCCTATCVGLLRTCLHGVLRPRDSDRPRTA